MSGVSTRGSNQPAGGKPLPTWIVSGVLGLVLGGGLTFLGLQFSGYPNEHGLAATANASSGPPPGMGGAMMGGGGGGGMMGGGMMGGASPPRGKRNLTTLVSKLDLASKGIPWQLDDKQTLTLAEKLASLEQLEKLTQDEAQEQCDALEAMLTEEQKGSLALFEMPRPARGAGGGPGGMAAGGSGGAAGAAPDDDNPFQEEANQVRLRSLLERLKGTSGGQ